MLTRLSAGTPLVLLLLAYGLFGLALGMVNPAITNNAVAGMPLSQAGVAAAIASTGRQVGAALGVAVAGTVAAASHAKGLDFAQATHPIWWITNRSCNPSRSFRAYRTPASSLKFDGHRFERLVAEVLFCLLDGRLPNDVTGLVFYRLGLACRVFDPKILIGEEDGCAIGRIRVHGSHSVRLDPDPQNAHLGVLKFQLVVAGIYFEWIEIAADRLVCPWCLQFDLDDIEIMIEDLWSVHPTWWAPHHLTRLPIEHRWLPPVLILESLPSRLEVDHHPVHFVLVELARHVNSLQGAGNLYLIVLEQHRRRSRWDRGQGSAQ